VIAKGPLQSALSFKVTERRVKRPQFGGRSWGHLGGTAPGRPATFGYSQSHPVRRRCSVLLIVLISNRGTAPNARVTKRRWRAVRWRRSTGTRHPATIGLTSGLPRVSRRRSKGTQSATGKSRRAPNRYIL